MKKIIRTACFLLAVWMMLLPVVAQSTTESTTPNFESMQYADGEFLASLDSDFESRKQAILTSASDYASVANGTHYYVSSSEGNDNNDGLAPDRAWASIAKVNSVSLNPGDAILFKRGDVWNRQGRLNSKANVTFSAYGEGPKPQFSWYVDASESSDWTAVGENLYVYSGAYQSNGNTNTGLPGSYLTSTDSDCDDVGNIIFDDDKGWGVKVLKRNDVDYSVDLGTVPTGFGTLTHNSRPFADQKDLSQHLEFYHNPEESRLYLYCEGGNPGDVFKNIKLVLKEYLFFGATANVCSNVRVDNLSFKYAGCHAISLNGAVYYTIQNCEIGFIGGSIQQYYFGGSEATIPTRFGEGIQNWGSCNDLKIQNNYIYQIYDGATSSQQSGLEALTECIMQNVIVSGNCYEYNTACIEFWMDLADSQGNNPNFMMKNWDMSKNLMRKTGYGFGATRPKDHRAGNGGAVHFTDSECWPKPMYENVLFTGNTAWDSRDGLFSGLGWDTSMYHLDGNVFVHEYGAYLGLLAKDFDNKALHDVAKYNYNSDTVDMLIEKNVVGAGNTFYYTYPKSVATAVGGGLVSLEGSGVHYTFDGIQSIGTPQGLVGTEYQTDSGIVLYNYADGASLSNDAEGNLLMTVNQGNTAQLAFVSDFTYPMHPDHSYFFDINALAIRYKVLNNGAEYQGNKTLTIQGGSGSTTATGDFVVPANEQWVETVIRLNANGSSLGWWGNLPDHKNHSIQFPALSEGATLVIDYIGLYHSAAEAALATKRACVAAGDAVKLYGAQVKTAGDRGVRFIGVIDDYTNTAYEEIGFKIQIGEATANAKIKKYVYDTIMNDGKSVSVPQAFVTGQGVNTKFFTYCLNGISKANCAADGTITFKVSSYAIIDGIEVCGTTTLFVYHYEENRFLDLGSYVQSSNAGVIEDGKTFAEMFRQYQ